MKKFTKFMGIAMLSAAIIAPSDATSLQAKGNQLNQAVLEKLKGNPAQTAFTKPAVKANSPLIQVANTSAKTNFGTKAIEGGVSTIGPASQWQTIDGPDGNMWLLTQEFVYNNYQVTSSTVTFYDETGAQVGELTITPPADEYANDIQILYINNTFFDSNSSTYNFPRRDGYTFDAAYSDDERLNKITDTFVHVGTVDYQTGTATNFRQNIYVDFLEGTRYRIETAEQLSVNGDESGYYEILDDLDFENGKISWPASLMAGNFTGRFEAAEQVTISNVLVTFARTGASDTQGGLFGTVEEEAVISNISFENVTFDLATVRQRLRNTRFGVFSGEIVEGAQITNVSLTGATMRIGSVTLGDGFAINLVANGDKSGLTYAPVTFVIYGSDLLTEDTPDVRYRYMINFELDASGAPTGITVDDEYNVTLTFATNNRKGSPEYTINYLEATNNE